MHCLAKVDLVLIELLIILFAGELKRVMFSVIALNDYAASFFTAAGTTRDLGQELKSPFGSAKIGHAQTGIDRDNADQRDIMKVVALGDHLSTDHEIDISAGELIEQFFESSTAACGIAIQPGDAHLGVHLFEQGLDLLCAFTDIIDIWPFAIGTGARHPLDMVAVMADQPRFVTVKCERDIAVRAS